MLTNAAQAGATIPARPGTQAWITLAILCFVYVLNFLDRSLLSILAKPIEDSLHITDGQLGLIGGLLFAVFYCFISIPDGCCEAESDTTKHHGTPVERDSFLRTRASHRNTAMAAK